LSTRRGSALAFLVSAMLAACGGGGPGISGVGSGGSSLPTGANVQSVSVNFGPTNNYVNGIFTSVTLCAPGTSNCQTIDNILVDTGSYGLRILNTQLSSSLASTLQAQTNPSGAKIAECTVYGDGFTWGPVTTADMQIAGETASSLPINIFGANGSFTGNFSDFPAPPSDCSSSGGDEEDTLATFGAYGVIGLGPFGPDCGQDCDNPLDDPDNPNPGLYYACASGDCEITTESVADQVSNPVPYFATDNNGLIVELPAISDDGQSTVTGALVFGIGTESNNALGSAQVLTLDDSANFITNSNGSIPGFTGPSAGNQDNAFIDSGSNALFFQSSIAQCSDSDFSGFYCPESTTNYSAVMLGVGTNDTSVTVPFSVANAQTLGSNNNGNDAAVDDLAGALTGSLSSDFDWGLPFFYGRNVYIGIQSANTVQYAAFSSN
jgi:hypothetical protein